MDLLTNQTTLLCALARSFGEAGRVPRPSRVALPGTAYADLFSRYRHNDKWDCHGDEAPS